MFDRSGDAFLSISLRNWEAEGLKQVENNFFEYFCYCGELANKKPYEHFFVKLALNMSPQTLKESTQDASNINHTRRQNQDADMLGMSIPLGTILDAYLGPTWDTSRVQGGTDVRKKS